MFAPSKAYSALDGEERQNDRATAETNHGTCGRAAFIAVSLTLPLDGDKLPVDCRKHRSPARRSNLEWLTALAATFIFPGEGKPRNGQALFPVKRCRLLSLLTQDLVDRYGALFLSRS